MLYVTTCNRQDTYIARAALQKIYAPDGGFFLPQRIPVLCDSMRFGISTQTACDTVAQMLNIFFDLQLTGWNVECAIGKHPFRLESVGHHLQMAEGWHNHKGRMDYLSKSLYSLLTDGVGLEPGGWAVIAIRIAQFAGICAEGGFTPAHKFDLAISADDPVDLIAALYARDMGLPIEKILYASDTPDAVWKLITKGILPSEPGGKTFWREHMTAAYFDCHLRNSCDEKQVRIDEETQNSLSQMLYIDVISEYRVARIVSGIYQTNGYAIESRAALAYGALQDYRASTGNRRDTVIICKEKPNGTKE